MTLTELHYIVAVAREKHFGRAADACHVSQPALSFSISKLEAELGVLIFERIRNEIRLTAMGKQIVEEAEAVLEKVSSIKDVAKADKSQLNHPITLGANFAFSPCFFPALIRNLKLTAPKMNIIIREDFDGNLRDQLMQGELDAFFVSLPFSKTGIVVQKLFEEPFMVLMSNDHALSKKRSIALDDLKKEKILVFESENCCLHPDIRNTFSTDKDVFFEGMPFGVVRQMIASNEGITIFPKSVAQCRLLGSGLCMKPFKDKLPLRQIALAWRVGFSRPKAITAISQAFLASL